MNLYAKCSLNTYPKNFRWSRDYITQTQTPLTVFTGNFLGIQYEICMNLYDRKRRFGDKCDFHNYGILNIGIAKSNRNPVKSVNGCSDIILIPNQGFSKGYFKKSFSVQTTNYFNNRTNLYKSQAAYGVGRVSNYLSVALTNGFIVLILYY